MAVRLALHYLNIMPALICPQLLFKYVPETFVVARQCPDALLPPWSANLRNVFAISTQHSKRRLTYLIGLDQ